VLTPHDTWHNHGNEGDEPAINLSVLDLPLAETLNSLYFEHDYTEEERRAHSPRDANRALPAELFSARLRQRRLPAAFRSRTIGARGAASPMYVYRYEVVREFLENCRDWTGTVTSADARVCQSDDRRTGL